MKRHRIKCRKPHADANSRRHGTNPLHHFPQESRAILKTSAVLPFPRVRAEKFVTQIPVAMFDVHKIETQFVSHFCRAMKVFNDRTDFAVSQNQIVTRQS